MINDKGNRGLKDLICTTHGHELSGGECWRTGGEGGGEIRGKIWENS